MKKTGVTLGLALVVLFWCGGMLLSSLSTATLPLQRKAQDLGFPAVNCLYCHNENFPKKGAVSHNDRGTWLIGEKTKRNAKEVDPAWLKDYPGNKK